MRTWVVFAVLTTACSGPAGGAGPDASFCAVTCPEEQTCSVSGECIPQGTCAVDADCAAGMRCSSQMMCIGGCGGEPLDLTYVPPNLHLVLDRSCSMRNNLMGTTTSKWDAAVASLTNVLATYATEMRWGLTMFPDTAGGQCSQDPSAFPVADNNSAPISSMLNAALVSTDPNYPDGPCVTNIDTGVQQAALDPGLADPGRSSYLMLISDGAQAGCSAGGGDAGTEAAIQDLNTNRGISTFVVGFGSGTDAAKLNLFATAGGMPLPGTTKYYQADTSAQLDLAFQAIADLVVSCDYTVDPPPPDLAKTWVIYENTELVPRDPAHVAGWDYDPVTMTLTMYGSYCDRLKTHVVDEIDVVFGCATPPVL